MSRVSPLWKFLEELKREKDKEELLRLLKTEILKCDMEGADEQSKA